MRELKNKRTLVTGGAGFIGSYLVERLIREGSQLHLLIKPEESLTRIADILNDLNCVEVDIRDYPGLKRQVRKINPDIVFHLAAITNVERSFELAKDLFETNLFGTMNLLRALNEVDYECFVNTGTCEEYGDNPAPFDEEQIPNPVSPYSASKVATTFFCHMLYKTRQAPIVTLRPFLSYGPKQSMNRFIPQAILACLQKKEFRMTPGEQTREFNYVTDIVDGFVKAAQVKQCIGEVINIGNGNEYQIKDVVKKIFGLMGSSQSPQFGALPYRPGETMHFYSNSQKAKSLLNWKPEVDLETGLKKSIEWYELEFREKRLEEYT